jgi:hypothetical protein
MPYEDLSTKYPSMRGIALELPFVKFKYVRVDRSEQERPKYTKQIEAKNSSEGKPPQIPSRMIMTREAEVTTFGMDPMVSSAAVIHELTYGRTDMPRAYSRQAADYPAPARAQGISLDIVI